MKRKVTENVVCSPLPIVSAKSMSGAGHSFQCGRRIGLDGAFRIGYGNNVIPVAVNNQDIFGIRRNDWISVEIEQPFIIGSSYSHSHQIDRFRHLIQGIEPPAGIISNTKAG